MTNRARLKAKKEKAYRFQSIRAGSRRPSRRQRDVGSASNPRPARSSGTSSWRNMDQPIGNDKATGRPSAQNGCSQARFDPTSVSSSARFVYSTLFRPEHGVHEIHQRSHGNERGQVEHGILSYSTQSDSHAMIRPKNNANRNIPSINVATATNGLLTEGKRS